MALTVGKMNEYAAGRGYSNWQEFRNDVGTLEAQEALKQIKLEDK